MIFSEPMLSAVLERRKTVTRRPVKYEERLRVTRSGNEIIKVELPCRYEVGKDYAVQPGRGQKAVGRIQILDVQRKPLGLVDSADAIREGFGGRGGFVFYWTGLYSGFDPTQLVDRIEFRLLEGEK